MNERPGNGKALFEGAHVAVTWSRHTHCLPWGKGVCLYKYITSIFSLFVMHVCISDVTQVAITTAEYKKKRANKRYDYTGKRKRGIALMLIAKYEKRFVTLSLRFCFVRTKQRTNIWNYLYKCIMWLRMKIDSSLLAIFISFSGVHVLCAGNELSSFQQSTKFNGVI